MIGLFVCGGCMVIAGTTVPGIIGAALCVIGAVLCWGALLSEPLHKPND